MRPNMLSEASLEPSFSDLDFGKRSEENLNKALAPIPMMSDGDDWNDPAGRTLMSKDNGQQLPSRRLESVVTGERRESVQYSQLFRPRPGAGLMARTGGRKDDNAKTPILRSTEDAF